MVDVVMLEDGGGEGGGGEGGGGEGCVEKVGEVVVEVEATNESLPELQSCQSL